MSSADRKFNDAVCLVTGGSSGIGRGIALEFAKNGADVIVADVQENPKVGKYHDTDLTTSTVEEIRKIGGNCLFIKSDCSDEASIDALSKKIESIYGRLDVLVNNAGRHIPGSIEELTVGQWDDVVALNLRGVFLVSKKCLKLLKKSDRGRIINIASVHAFGGSAGPAYAPAKSGVVNLTKDMSLSLGKYGITVNAICPGYIETPIQDYLTPQEIEDYKASLSIKRLGRPRDIANATLFLASQESEWITGTSLIVDGGSLASV